ncbi:uncharacterized protein PFL1_03994 [Pseudozyma flocculosa PF-1]|uniref:Related to Maltose permease n=2 Tax=Pseudozyma flocculosa TaxID=84751 RepID=A0A5C3EYC1_9BASI|nr:uncharacterized protein PFL1_03994 [Pseudozyma flocculosa PF-1]EPQ28691.1 hypothetical protein PFL1_03994 [Pseudozyma flocculosa PF-1]SPO36646.1 related to Maltose permease [Pseudozyma flocculosa]
MEHVSELGSAQPTALVTAEEKNLAARLDGDHKHTAQLAAKADDDAHKLTIRQALRRHSTAAAWSALLSTALIMEGFDLIVISSFFGQSQFLQRYGKPDGKGGYALSSAWQTGLTNSAVCGEIIGLAINSWASDRFGYRRTYMAAMAMMAACIFATFFSPSLPILSLGEVLCGIPWGIFQTLTTAYASEICPMALRPFLTTYVNMCWGVGILLSSGVTRATLDIHGKLAYKLPFALQWIWPVPLFVGAFLAPESPWWLVRKARYDEAKHSIRRLTNADQRSEARINEELALIRYTTALEEAETAGATLLDCFRGTNRRRTEVACVVFAIQYLSGSPLISFAVLFLQKAGLSETNSFNFNLGMNSMYVVGTIVSWFLMSRFGRRSLYLFGVVIMGLTCLVIGGLGVSSSKSASLAIGAMMVVLNLSYNVSIGPVCYALVAELSSSRLRAKTVVLARTSYNLTGLVTNTIQPRMIAADQWNWGAKSGFFWLGSCTVMFVYCYLRLPETRHRNTGELDVLFENRVSARKFASTAVDQFHVAPVAAAGSSPSAVARASESASASDDDKLEAAGSEK